MTNAHRNALRAPKNNRPSRTVPTVEERRKQVQASIDDRKAGKAIRALRKSRGGATGLERPRPHEVVQRVVKPAPSLKDFDEARTGEELAQAALRRKAELKDD